MISLILNPVASVLNVGAAPQLGWVHPGISLFFGKPPSDGRANRRNAQPVNIVVLKRLEIDPNAPAPELSTFAAPTPLDGHFNALAGYSDDAQQVLIESCFHAQTLAHFERFAELSNSNAQLLAKQKKKVLQEGRQAGVKAVGYREHDQPLYAQLAALVLGV